MSKKYCLPIRLKLEPNSGFIGFQFLLHLLSVGIVLASLPVFWSFVLSIPVLAPVLILVWFHRYRENHHLNTIEIDQNGQAWLIGKREQKHETKIKSQCIVGSNAFLLIGLNGLRVRIKISREGQFPGQWHRFRVFCLGPESQDQDRPSEA